MFTLPEDVEKMLTKKYPNVHIRGIIDSIFQGIRDKTLQDGACMIREFGKFVSFKTVSTKTGCDTLRFKFKISTTFNDKIKNDEFLLNNAPVKSKVPFTEEHAKKCMPVKDIKLANIEAQAEALRLSKEKTHENIQTELILDALRDMNTSQ